jgi:hypothetical protein
LGTGDRKGRPQTSLPPVVTAPLLDSTAAQLLTTVPFKGTCAIQMELVASLIPSLQGLYLPAFDPVLPDANGGNGRL